MARIDNLQNFIEDVGQAIKDKKGIPEEQKIQVRDFDTEIMSIETGGGDPLDPQSVYDNTRPKDWIPMPEDEDVLNNEIYLLIDVAGDKVPFSFMAIFTGQAYIDFGDGTQAQQLTSNSQINYFYDRANLTIQQSTGNRQALARVWCENGNFTNMNLNVFHPSKTNTTYGQPILEVKMRATEITGMSIGYFLNEKNIKLTYFNYLGSNKITSMSSMFQNCPSLTSIPQLDTSSVTNMSDMFRNCRSLAAIPQLDTSSVTNMYYMFQNCYSLTAIPQLDTSSVTNMDSMFSICYSLAAIPQLNTSSVTNMYNMFGYCYSLTAIPQLDTSSVTNMDNIFNRCYSLANISFVPNTQIGTTAITLISFSNNNLSRQAILNIGNNLPIANVQKTFNFSGTVGAYEGLSPEDIAIFTDKGYLITI